MIPRCPTPEECSSNAVVAEDASAVFRAIWYPQMGGYVGRAVVRIDRRGASYCFEAYVWHDGEFPFDPHSDQAPAYVHHCSPDQFVKFGETVRAMQLAIVAKGDA